MELLTVAEVAKRLRLSGRAIRALCEGAEPKLRHHRVGAGRGSIRIPEDAVEEYLRSSEVSPLPKSEPFRRYVPQTLQY